MRGKVVSMICNIHHIMVKGSVCPMCVEEVKRESPAVHVWKPTMFTDICETPILIESKRQLKRECEKHGVRSYILPR
jgi:hypothetical protein